MRIFCVILITIAYANIDCIDSVCSSCTIGYLHNSISCLTMCPTGYTQSQEVCTSTANLNVFTLYFFEYTLFNGINIGQFFTPSNIPFSSQSELTPIPTFHQGFYFTSSSSLNSIGAGWILSPTSSLNLYFLASSPGTIFQVFDGSTLVLSFLLTQSTVELSLILSNSLQQASLHTFTFQFPFPTAWAGLSVSSIQANGLFSVTVSSQTSSMPGYEFRYQSNQLSYYIGDPSASGQGYQGFIYYLSLDNQVRLDAFLTWPGYQESVNEYTFGWNPVQSCSSSCTNTWPWCIRASCSVCYSDNCKSCNGYGLDECTVCADSQNSPPACGLSGFHCYSGEMFNCLECYENYSLIDGLCLNGIPYGYNPDTLSSPVVDIKFSTIQQYYGRMFSSGLNSATYSPVNPRL